MASLINLPLPVARIDKGNGNDANNDVGDWDERFGEMELWKESLSSRASISSHAVAHGYQVFGTYTNANDNDKTTTNNSTQTEWTTWKASFEPHRVCKVASNHDGSVVVASTDGGTVSLLRGNDGKVLATRKVSKAEGLQQPAEISFVGGTHRHEAKDVLIILVPPSTDDNAKEQDHPKIQQQQQQQQHQVNVILVSAIDGPRLNGESPSTIAEAARTMSIHGLSLELPSQQILALQGCFLNSYTIRFIAVERTGNLSIHDYDINEKKSKIINRGIPVSQGWTFDTNVRIGLQLYGPDRAFFLLAFLSEKQAKIGWFDVNHLTMNCEHLISKAAHVSASSSKKNRPKVLAIEPISSCSKGSALAIAVALKSSDDCVDATIQILQAVAETTTAPEFTLLSQPHVVYNVPIRPPSEASAVQSIDLVAVNCDSSGPYSFRYKAWFEADLEECKEFITTNHLTDDDGTTIGRFRLLIAQKLYDDADELLASETASKIASRDPFAMIHSSEVALKRLQEILASGNVSSKQNMENAKDCLRRLAGGAVSGHEIGIKCLLDAADSVSSWPTNISNDNDDIILKQPMLREVFQALSAMIATISGAIPAAPPVHAPKLREKKKLLDDHMLAIKCMETVLQTKGKQVFMAAPFSSVRTPSDLFDVLIGGGFFSIADRVVRSDWGREIPFELMASSILGISPKIDPRGYGILLSDIVIPGLTVNHEMLPLIRTWACRTADAFDEDSSNDDLGLESSIFLLQIVLNATKKLHIRIHSSFASSTPFIERKEIRRSRVSPRNTSMDSNSGDFSFYSTSSSPIHQKSRSFDSTTTDKISVEDERPIPTILELGKMKSGAMKSRLGSLPSKGSNATFDNEGEDNDDSVEIKLRHAKELKAARQLGLKQRKLTLSNYPHSGGACHVAKELVNIFSNTAVDDEERFVALTERVEPFCENAGVNYDDALVLYTKELCDSKRTSEKAILETASISRCCSKSLVKCQVALTAFRAALLCGIAPTYLSSLSKDALVWAAGDSSIRSELEEAIRLLVVADIILRYCGSGARELFRVDHLRHSVKLLDFVCRHIDHTSVLSDALDLCDAFTHLSRTETCSLIIERAVKAGKPDRCVEILTQIYLTNDMLALDVCARATLFCMETIGECSDAVFKAKTSLYIDTYKHHAVAASAAACSMLIAIQELAGSECGEGLLEQLGANSWGTLQDEMERISELQSNHALFLSLSDLRSETRSFDAAKLLLDPVVQSYFQDCTKDLKSTFALAKRGAYLLFGNDEVGFSKFWFRVIGDAACQLARASDGGPCIELLGAAGVLDKMEKEEAVHVALSVALSLCVQASKVTVKHSDDNTAVILPGMKYVVRASSLLQDYALISCSRNLLAATVSLASLTDIVTQVLTRADEGIGEVLDSFRIKLNRDASNRRESFESKFKNTSTTSNDNNKYFLSRIKLHPSWYVGDGLLLPPSEALSCCVAYCKELIGVIRAQRLKNLTMHSDTTKSLHRFLGIKGAHSIALKLLCNSTAIRLSIFSASSQGMGDIPADQETLRCLAERSLGGSGNGITSGNIDSQMAVSFLLSLPIKLAFKLYKSALPTALSRRDFSRVLIIANVGYKAGATENLGWKKQTTFVSQCLQLSKRSRWWRLLQEYQVLFDPHSFDDKSTSAPREVGAVKHDRDNSRSKLTYIASLIPALIQKASIQLKSPKAVRNLVTKFAISFGLNPHLAAQKHVEYLLSCPSHETRIDDIDVVVLGDDHETYHADIRHNVILCERAARESLNILPSAMARSAVLRRCLVDLEKSEAHFTDYERHASLLSLYHVELSKVVTERVNQDMSKLTAFIMELELIDRRRDVLAILSSFFQGRRKAERPNFPEFFGALPVPFNPEATSSSLRKVNTVGVLDVAREKDSDTFDPLAPLKHVLSSNLDSATATALAPLCLPIGVPRGFIHARSLIYRFRMASTQQGALPSFEGDVLPTMHRLTSFHDKTELAEWCATQYVENNEEKLKCFEHALTFAVKASNETEQRRNSDSKNDKKLAEDENRALDTVKRVSKKKSILFDKLVVNRKLASSRISSSEQLWIVQEIMDDLVERIQKQRKTELLPESFVEFLLSEASLIVAEASLDEEVACSVSHFRQLASLVHDGCKALADQHSHVHAGYIARLLARRWLVHGDQLLKPDSGSHSSPKEEPATHQRVDLSLSVAEEDDTIDFVMDLNSIGNGEQDDVGPSLKSRHVEQVTSEEEPSSLRLNGSSREASEFGCRRVALRIAFVMSFAEEFHSQGQDDKENDNASSNHHQYSKNECKKTRSTLLSRIATGSRSSQSSSVMEHTRELLQVVFAQSGGSTWVASSKSLLNTSSETSFEKGDETRKTITFAMRHRALRTASVLCPQEALDRVIKEEGYLSIDSSHSSCTLKQCAYGAFVAKEIEEIGLPLPHSDLAQLSTMHFPSYARALWRHHSSSCSVQKGRLLLLLIEMSLKEDIVTDKTLVVSALTAMSELDLPRSSLIGCERVADFTRRCDSTEFVALFAEVDEAFSKAVTKVARSIFSEIHKTVVSENSSLEVTTSLSTVRRLGKLVEQFSDRQGGQGRLQQFVEVLMSALPMLGSDHWFDGLASIALSGISRLEENKEVLLKLFKMECGKKAIQFRFPPPSQFLEETVIGDESTTLVAVANSLESSFSSSFALVVSNEE